MPKFGPWEITVTEERRLKVYERMNDLYRTDSAKTQDTIYQAEIQKKPSDNNPHMWLGLPSLISRKSAELVCPEPPRLTSKDAAVQTRLDELSRVSDLYRLAWRAIYWMSAQGDVYVTIADVDMGKSQRKPVLSLRRATNSVARGLRVESGPKNRRFCFRSCLDSGVDLFTEYVSGSVKHYAYKGETPDALPAGYEAVIDTKEIDPLCVHLASLVGDATDESLGEADISGVEILIFTISERLRQIRQILNKHADPPMNVPEGVIDEEGKFDPSTKKVFSKDFNGNGAEYVQWNSQLDAAYKNIESLLDLVLVSTGTPKALLGRDAGAAAESGRALMFRILDGLTKARRNAYALSAALAAAARLALRREDILAGKSPGDYDVQCKISGKFIVDETERNAAIVALRQASAMSIEDAVAERGLSGDEAQAEVDRIKTETAGANAPPLGFDANNQQLA